MTAPAISPMAALAGLGGTLTNVVMSPVRRWNQSSTMHKIIALSAGAGIAYYLHKKEYADLPVAAAGLAAAWGTSALMHYPAVAGTVVQAPISVAPGALPATTPAALPAPIEEMTQQAEAVMSGMGAYKRQPSPHMRPQEQTVAWQQRRDVAQQPSRPESRTSPPQPSGGASKWAILDQ